MYILWESICLFSVPLRYGVFPKYTGVILRTPTQNHPYIILEKFCAPHTKSLLYNIRIILRRLRKIVTQPAH